MPKPLSRNQGKFSLLMVIFMALLVPFAAWGASDQAELRILTWSLYIDIDDEDEKKDISLRSPTLREFSKLNNCKLKYIEYDTHEQMEKLLLNSPHYFDVIISDNEWTKGLIKSKQLLELKVSLPLDKIGERYRPQKNTGDQKFFMPYLSGTTGLAYRKDVFPSPPTWKTFFEPTAGMKGKVAILDEPRSMFFFSMRAIGRDGLNPSSDDVKAGGKLIAKLLRSPAVGFLGSKMESIHDGLSSGNLVLSPLYSGDAFWMQESIGKDKLGYTIPPEGGEFFVDNLMVLKKSSNPDLAQKFIQYVTSAKIQKRLSQELGFVSPYRFEEPDTQQPKQIDPILAPSDEMLQRCFLLTKTSVDHLIDRYWLKFREEL